MKYSEEVEQAVCKAARAAASSWGSVMEYDDIHQELWLFLLESPSVQRKPLEELVPVLRWKANAICKQSQVDYEYFSGNFQYSPGEVRKSAKSMSEYDGTADEQADFDLAIEILWKHKPEKFEDLEDWFENQEEWNTGKVSTRKRIQRMFDALTDAMNDVRRARSSSRVEGPGTKPREPKPPIPVNDWGIYKQGVLHD